MKLSWYILPGAFFAGTIIWEVLVPATPQKHVSIRSQDTLVTYEKNILPLLKANCTPCHFPGGKVYKKLPFEDYATVARLGKKLNTRLQKPEQQTVINAWVRSGMKEKE